MKTLEQLNEKVVAEVNLRVQRSMSNPLLANLTNEAELANFHRPFVINDIVVQLFDIVKVLDSYLQMPSLDGRTQRQEVRKTLQAMIDKL